jgi:hypothetical protein
MSAYSLRSRLGQTGNMPSNRPCYRHAAGVWMAYCPDCTAWYLPVQITHRGNKTTASGAAQTAELARPTALSHSQ